MRQRVIRLSVGFAVALVLSVGLEAAGPKLPKPKKQSAVCSLFDPWSPPWILFGCMFDPPPRDPTT